MDLARAIQVLLIVLLLGAAAVKGLEATQRAIQHREQQQRRLSLTLAAALAVLGLAQLLSLPPITDAVAAATALGVGKLLYNLLVIVGLLGLLIFYTGVGRGLDRGRRHITADVTVAGIVVVVLIVATIATPPGLRDHSVTQPANGLATVVTFYIVGNAYFVYAYGAGFLWAVRFARRSRSSTPAAHDEDAAVRRWLAAALGVIGLGLLGLAVTALVRVVVVSLAAAGPAPSLLNTANFSVNNLSYVLLAIGMSLLGAWTTVRVIHAARWQRRLSHDLEPLRSTLRASLPGVVLGTDIGTHSSWWAIGYSRAIACHDGLLRLSPTIQRLADRDPAQLPPEDLAAYVRSACTQLHTAVDDPNTPHQRTPDAPQPVATSISVGMDANLDRLRAVSRALADTNRPAQVEQ